MYKCLLLLLLSLGIAFFSLAQPKTGRGLWHLTVVDSATAQGLAKATIAISGRKYLSTDANGTISIDKGILEAKDSLRISSVGYKPAVYIPDAADTLPDTIRLSPAVTSLKEVRINSSDDYTGIQLGLVKKAHVFHFPLMPNGAYAQFIPNDQHLKGTITAVNYVLNDVLHGIELPLRVRLYTKMKDSITLDRELTTDSIIVYNQERKRNLSVDISRFHIPLPAKGIIAVIETLSPDHYKDSVVYLERKRCRMPGLELYFRKNCCNSPNDKNNRTAPYSMVGPEADRWNLNGARDQWYVYEEGTNFAISVTVEPDKD